MEEFKLFTSYFYRLYYRYILSLLMCRIYAIKKIDGLLVMLPSKVKYGEVVPLDAEDFSFLDNQDEDIKHRFSEMFEVSYDEYIKKYGRYIGSNYLHTYWNLRTPISDAIDWIYANPAYVELQKDGVSIKFIRKFDYISFGDDHFSSLGGSFDTRKNMYVYVDTSLGLVIGGHVELRHRGSHHYEGEDYVWEKWDINFFTSDVSLGRYNCGSYARDYSKSIYLSFENFCKENYQKDIQTGKFYLIPYHDIEKWNEEQKIKLSLHSMSYEHSYDEEPLYGNTYAESYYLRGNEYKRRMDYSW